MIERINGFKAQHPLCLDPGMLDKRTTDLILLGRREERMDFMNVLNLIIGLTKLERVVFKSIGLKECFMFRLQFLQRQVHSRNEETDGSYNCFLPYIHDNVIVMYRMQILRR